jgi:insertion element IS1 protein InsB
VANKVLDDDGQIARSVRKTLSFSKCVLNHLGALWYFIRHYNKSFP